MKQVAIDFLGQPSVEKATTVIAGASVSSYWWLEYISNNAAAWLPILGCSWLILQGIALIYRTWFKKDTDTKGQK